MTDEYQVIGRRNERVVTAPVEAEDEEEAAEKFQEEIDGDVEVEEVNPWSQRRERIAIRRVDND